MFKQQFLTNLTDSYVVFTGVGQAQYDTLGDIRWERGGAGMAAYKFVQSSGTTAFAIGDFLCYTAAGIAGTNICDAANTSYPAGVAMFANATAAALLGWVQVQGVATLNTPTATTTGYEMTSTGAANKSLKVRAAVTDNIAGLCLAAAGTPVMLALPTA